MQVIKVIIIVVFLLASMVGVILGAGYLAANNPMDNSHKHELTLVEASDPTCTTPGYRKHYSCAGCQDTFADANGFKKLEASEITIAPFGHNVKAASCTEGKFCETCQQTVSEAPGHTIVVDPAVEAGCTENGKTEGSHCSVCGEIIVKQNVITATGHEFDSNTDYECNKCDYVRTTDECPHIAEDMTKEVTAPTCTNVGYTTYTCNCGYYYVTDETPPTGHTDVTDGAVAPGCLSTGLSEGKHCSVCGTVTESQKTVAAKGTHNWNGLTCSDCQATKFEAESSDITYVMPDGETKVVSTGREGKTPEQTNFPSGDSFVYFMSYSDTTTLTFYVTASQAGKATISVRMGRATNSAALENLFYVEVNGVRAESRPDVIFPKWESGSAYPKYYDWLELEISDVELGAGENVIKVIKPYPDPEVSDPYNSSFGLNFDYMAITPENPDMKLQDSRDVAAGGHVNTVVEIGTAPTYKSAGELRIYCENCRTYEVVALPVVSTENYTRISGDSFNSTWEYTHGEQKFQFTIVEETKKYTFTANTASDPFTAANGGSVLTDGVASGLKEESGSIFYPNTNATTHSYTMKIYVEEATTVKLYVGAAKNNASLAPNKILQNLQVNGSTDGVTYSTTKISWSNKSPDNWFIFKESYIAIIELSAGENVITFEVIKTSLNLDSVTIESTIPVVLKKQTTEG